ncbi:MAG: hypothetical protein ACD_16C00089G0007 [uncultured bacterium]|nr:MAG: hypothetical protein ACD_16C00089G0007 [uncultured bacterium]OFW68583.1 MAG: hypothetical protein A2X70_02460 [Alphaproteobacteria bacterium GWC2_42_16]OFW73646.1 MAG: hypothetical protein A2Z80_02135 [Alphaproteobacteria bacterium GWA2_41_27]OFW81618.1 MAG: hypothetical protein A3E50_06510 [Alphaproteobacteria bacterium RIFCSPHIGHO2_12_FULL_42_100]OFW85366.1 MAG: hypothetical protein A2W06_03985 [Alphaproteobacteria bacterium RBG_16_42_14]OFW90500.1 MAG: hypothetical protein A3C41_063
MKVFFFFIFTVALFALIGGVYLVDPGSVEILWFGYSVQLSAILATGVLVFCVLAFLILGYSLWWVIHLPSRWISAFQKSQTTGPQFELLRLLSLYEEESLNVALSFTKKMRKKFESIPLFLWISGNIFEKTGHHLEAEQAFMSLLSHPDTFFLGLKGQIRSALKQGDYNRAYELLKHAEKDYGSSPWVLKHLLAVAREKKKFIDAEKIALRLDDLGYLTKEQSKKQLGYIEYQEALDPHITPDQKEAYLRQAHYLDPSLSQVSEMLADMLHQQGHKTQALSVLQATWIQAPTQKIGDLFLKFTSPKNEVEAFQKAKEFVKKNPNNSESLLFIARTGLKAKLWGETRVALTELLKEHPTTIAYQLMAHLEYQEHQNMKAAMEWLELGLQAPRYSPPLLF